jgi:serine/threonine protein kinase
LKPDNILLDAMGHAHLTDFNVAVHASPTRLHTSVAGSMAYMAPQVVGRKGYNSAIDWWSLGVTAYELIFHKRPFDGRTSERMTQAILKDPLKFPEDSRLKCSDAGIRALKGVRLPLFYHRISTHISLASSLTETQKHGLGVGQTVRGTRIFDDTPGLLLLTGTTLKTRKLNLLLFLMFVRLSFWQGQHGSDPHLPDEIRQF